MTEFKDMVPKLKETFSSEGLQDINFSDDGSRLNMTTKTEFNAKFLVRVFALAAVIKPEHYDNVFGEDAKTIINPNYLVENDDGSYAMSLNVEHLDMDRLGFVLDMDPAQPSPLNGNAPL